MKNLSPKGRLFQGGIISKIVNYKEKTLPNALIEPNVLFSLLDCLSLMNDFLSKLMAWGPLKLPFVYEDVDYLYKLTKYCKDFDECMIFSNGLTSIDILLLIENSKQITSDVVKKIIDQKGVFRALCHNKNLFYYLTMEKPRFLQWLFLNNNFQLLMLLVDDKYINFLSKLSNADGNVIEYFKGLKNPKVAIKAGYNEFYKKFLNDTKVLRHIQDYSREIEHRQEDIRRREELLKEKDRVINDKMKKLEESLRLKPVNCVICLNPMPKFIYNMFIKDLIITKCAHVFHRSCILDALKNTNKCPICRMDAPLVFSLLESEYLDSYTKY